MKKLYIIVTIAVLLFCQPVIAQLSWKIAYSGFVFNDPPFAQCHASTLVEASRGEILAAWFGGSHEGNRDVRIWMSKRAGNVWSSPVAVADGSTDNRQYPCWNPVLFKSSNGTIFLYYKVGPNPREWWGMYKTSTDQGKTWSAAARLPEGVLGPIKNKPVELSDGTIISPSSTESLTEVWKTHIERSEDHGKTWQIIPVDHASEFNVIQPSVLLHPDGRLQLLCRSKEGNVIQSWSSDNGKSWTRLSRTTLLNPNSGTDAITLKNNWHLIVYNPLVPGKEWFNGRYRLNVAASKDGNAWSDIAVLENAAEGEFSYPAIIQSSDGKVHISYTSDRKNIRYIILEPAGE